uniref:Putative secreted protein n=1 Tax=Anopheles triannulatus TaxID=58253 RepID=A0A2M4B1S7_9DIPT
MPALCLFCVFGGSATIYAPGGWVDNRQTPVGFALRQIASHVCRKRDTQRTTTTAAFYLFQMSAFCFGYWN